MIIDHGGGWISLIVNVASPLKAGPKGPPRRCRWSSAWAVGRRTVPKWAANLPCPNRRFISNPVKGRERRLNTPRCNRTRPMTTTRKLLPPLALVGALALVPVTASSFAAADTANYQELEKFMSVYERVKANYVDQVDDETLIKGAIDGMLSSLDPHSSYRRGVRLRPAADHHRRQLRRARHHRLDRGWRGQGDRADRGHAGVARGHQGRRLHHPHQRRAALRPVARRSGREDARRARHSRSR